MTPLKARSYIKNPIDESIAPWNPFIERESHVQGPGEHVRIRYNECVYGVIPEEIKPKREPAETEEEFYRRYENWESSNRIVIHPEPELFYPPAHIAEREKVDLRRDYGHSGLQIIVKLANIHLTPEKPRYEEGTWHVEGQLNEHICASAIYYHSSHNVTESRLSFRQRACSVEANGRNIEQEQWQHDWLTEVFGCENRDSTLQELGSVSIIQGRLLTFRNTLQHLVGPFGLADRTKPGHRKIVALFLVDPNIKIISTANVPCQRRDWWADKTRTRTQEAEGNRLGSLPNELWDANVEGFPISMEEAKESRLDLIEERTGYSEVQGDRFENEIFNLCEH